MRKVLAVLTLLLTFMVGLPAATQASSVDPQIRVVIGDRNQDRDYRRGRDRRDREVYGQRENRQVRIVTRDVRDGRRIYRETYRVVYRNGRTRTVLMSRVLIGREDRGYRRGY